MRMTKVKVTMTTFKTEMNVIHSNEKKERMMSVVN